LGGKNQLSRTAQPEAPALVLAGASGWAVNDWIKNYAPRWQSKRP